MIVSKLTVLTKPSGGARLCEDCGLMARGVPLLAPSLYNKYRKIFQNVVFVSSGLIFEILI